VERMII